jgi:hypothetical protein
MERGWNGANEHYTQQNSNLDSRIFFANMSPLFILVLVWQKKCKIMLLFFICLVGGNYWVA